MAGIIILGALWFHICISGMLVRKPPVVHAEWRTTTAYNPYQDKTTESISKCPNLEECGDQEIDSNDLVTSSSQLNTEFYSGNKTHNEELKRKVTFKSLLRNVHFIRLMIMELFSTIGVFGILYILPALAQERGSDDVTSTLTVTVTGAAELLIRKVVNS